MDISNRELATIIWFSLLFLGIFIISSDRKDIFFQVIGLLKLFFEKRIFVTTIFFVFYVSSVLYVCHLVGIWDISRIFEAFLWICAAFSALFKLTEKKLSRSKIKSVVLSCVTLSFVAEYLANMVSFSLFVEMLTIPVILLLSMMLAVAESKEKYRAAYSLIKFFLAAYGISILSYTAYSIHMDSSLITVVELKKFIFPFIATLLYTPFLYFLFLHGAYENILVALRPWPQDEALARKMMWKIFRVFKFNLFKLEDWQHAGHLANIRTLSDLEAALKSKANATA